MSVAKWSKCFIIRIPAVCQIQQELSNAPAFQELLHPFSIFHPLQLKQAWEHTEVGRARRIRALEPPMSVPGFGAQHDPKTSQDSSLLPLSPECSLPSAAQMGPQQLIFDWMGENSQISVNSSIRLDAFVDSPDSPSTTVKALAVAPRIALLSTLPILPVHKCSHILPVCCYMLLYVAMHMSHLPYTGHVGTRTRRRRICHLVMEMLDQNFQSFVCHILSHVSIDIHCVSDVFIDVLYISHYISILYYNNYWYY